MYLSFYRLKAKPFQITCDPKFLWLGDKHQEALAMLHYGISDNRGFLLLTGEVGTGKTLLINHLVTLLPDNTVVAKLSDPELNPMEFYRMLADGFEMRHRFKDKAEFLIQFREFLYEKAAAKQRVMMILDEAHRLDDRLLEVIRALSNIEFHDRKLIDIFFVGQPELNRLLMREGNRALAQRFTLRHHIDPLDLDETASYIRHRLSVAGGGKKLFNRRAVKRIYEYAGGIPRLINIICDHALLTGYIANAATINASIVSECARELHIPTRHRTVSNIRAASDPLKKGGAAKPVDGPFLLNKDAADKGAFADPTGPGRYPKPSWMAKWLHGAIFVFILVFWALVLINLKSNTRPNRIETAFLPEPQTPPMTTQLPPRPVERDVTLEIGTRVSTKLLSPEIGGFEMPETEAQRMDPLPAPRNRPLAMDPGRSVPATDGHLTPATGVADDHLPSAMAPTASDSASAVITRKPSNFGRQSVQAPVSLGWPEREPVIIRFDKSQSMAGPSDAMLNQVAADLVRFPERLVHIEAHTYQAGPLAHRQMLQQQMVGAVTAYLIKKGAHAYQIQSVGSQEGDAGSLAQRQCSSCVLIAFPRDHQFTDYNPDK